MTCRHKTNHKRTDIHFKKSYHDTFPGLHHCWGMLLKTLSVLRTWRAGTKDGVPSKLPLLWTLIKLLFVWSYGSRSSEYSLTLWNEPTGKAKCLLTGCSRCHGRRIWLFLRAPTFPHLSTGSWLQATSLSSSGFLWNVTHRVQSSYREDDTDAANAQSSQDGLEHQRLSDDTISPQRKSPVSTAFRSQFKRTNVNSCDNHFCVICQYFLPSDKKNAL